MPPSQKGMPFKRKDIATPFFDLDFPGNKPSTANKTPNPRDRSDPVASQSPAVNEARGHNNVSLLTLPVEIRLQIYNLLLVTRFSRIQDPFLACQTVVRLHMNRTLQSRTMEPGILQTCKQIYHEANSILYSQNVFSITEPEEMFQFIAQIGPINIKLVKSLDIWVPENAELFPWLRLLDILAEEANGLRFVKLGWGANSRMLGGGAWMRGLGDNLHFVRALGKIRGLEKLAIQGFYAKHWPAYLEETTGVQVQAISGRFLPAPVLREGDPLREELIYVIYIHDMNEDLQMFREYQQGTEDLIP